MSYTPLDVQGVLFELEGMGKYATSRVQPIDTARRIENAYWLNIMHPLWHNISNVKELNEIYKKAPLLKSLREKIIDLKAGKSNKSTKQLSSHLTKPAERGKGIMIDLRI